jgi:glycosyltransferase involved in cell wall biosynthesis
MIEKREKLNIGVITMPSSLAGITPLSNLIDVLRPSAGALYLITGGASYDCFKQDRRIRICEFRVPEPHFLAGTFAVEALRSVYRQLKASFKLARVGGRVDAWIFFRGAESMPLAILAARLLGRKVLVLLAVNFVEASAARGAYIRTSSLLYKASYLLSNHIILYSDLIREWNLEPYRRKIIIAHRHFLNFDEFKLNKSLEKRDSIIGYVGRLSADKGILNLVEAIPKTLARRGDVKFVIVGGGALEGDVRTSLGKYHLEDKVKLTGWISHSELPDYLNTFKLLVLPSYAEGLPNIMLESMACGTPVLATSVGAIREVIKDKQTGFLLSDNSPGCIAKGIVDTLSDPNLEKVAINARSLVQSEFRYESTVKTWANVLRTIERDA